MDHIEEECLEQDGHMTERNGVTLSKMVPDTTEWQKIVKCALDTNGHCAPP